MEHLYIITLFEIEIRWVSNCYRFSNLCSQINIHVNSKLKMIFGMTFSQFNAVRKAEK